MNLSGKRTPGRPFLDIAAGWNQGIACGVCFACPIIDETGNFLIADRNANPLYSTETNNGCAIKLKWQPAGFLEPGLAYMQGVKDVIWEQKLFDGSRITGYLYDLAESQGLGDATPAAREWVTARWQEIARSPYNNDTMRSYMLALLRAALDKKAEERTPGEKKLIGSFATYIQQRRTYLAEQALAMYDAWKASDDLYRQDTGQSRQLGSLFYYGTVPLDFHGTLSGLMTLGAAGGGVAGSMVAMNKYWQAKDAALDAFAEGTTQARREPVGAWHTLKGLDILKSPEALAIVSGASVIQVAFAILQGIAIDQFVAIQTARPKLEASLMQAKQPVDLAQLATTASAEDTMFLYWSKAMDTTDPEDPQVLQLAATAQAIAEKTGYKAPPKVTVTIQIKPKASIYSGISSGFLNQDEKLVSSNGKYTAMMQSDGNFVIYAGSSAIWATGSNGKGVAPYKLAMQADVNLVVYGSSNAIWASGPRGGTAPYTLIMQDDGNLVIYDSSNRAVWASGTKR
jgi:hypothetical protein